MSREDKMKSVLQQIVDLIETDALPAIVLIERIRAIAKEALNERDEAGPS